MKTNSKVQLYPLVRVVAMLMAGMLVGEWLSAEVAPVVWITIAAVLVFLDFWLTFRRKPVSESLTLLSAAFLFGAGLMAHAERSLAVTWPEREVAYEAVVVSEPQVRGRVLRCDLLVVGGDAPLKVKASILRDTVDNRWRRLHVGDGLRAVSRIEPPSNFRPSDFDYARWLQLHGFRGQTFIYYRNWQKAAVSLESLSMVQRTRLAALTFRRQLADTYSGSGLQGDELAVLAAMTLGEKSLLDKELKDTYSVSGASHVLALSGLHLGIIFALLTLFLPRRRSLRWAVGLLTVLALWAYAVLTGLSPSVVRSALMLSIYALIQTARHQNVPLNTLALAALVMLLANPLSLYDVGFQLSFLSVLSILVFYRPLESLFPEVVRRRCKPLSWLWSLLAVSIAAQIGTAPLVACYFGRFSCYGFLTNIVVVPAATAILYGAVLFFLLMAFPLLQSLVAQGLLAVVSFLNGFLARVAALPGASIEGILLSPVQVVLVYVLIACLTVALAVLYRAHRRSRVTTVIRKNAI